MRLEPKEEGMRWLLQARQDLEDAEFCFQGKRFNLACFLSQQAAEKAVKAFIYAQGVCSPEIISRPFRFYAV